MKTYNICFIGDSCTGKSHLIHSYVNGYKSPYVNRLTIGIEFNKKLLDNCILHIWDYSQASIIDKYVRKYLENIDFYFIVANCDDWKTIQSIRYYQNTIKNAPYYILLNKCDKIDNMLYRSKLLEYLRENIENKYVFTSSYNKPELDTIINNILNIELFN